MRKPWKHQQYAIDKYKDRKAFGLLLPTGTGKTFTATRIAELKDKPVLIIAPNALCNQWAEELTNKNEENRITTEDWNVLVCSSKTKNTKRFKEAFKKLREE